MCNKDTDIEALVPASIFHDLNVKTEAKIVDLRASIYGRS